MTKFQEVKERADVLEEIVNSFDWMVNSTENSIKDWETRLGDAQEQGIEDNEWEEGNIAKFKYRLSVIKEVEKMLEKML